MNLSPHFSLAELVASQVSTRQGIDNTPAPAVVANLTQPTDPGTKKALRRIRRVITANS